MRRRMILGLGMALLLAVSVLPAGATQEATPADSASQLEGLGLPTLDVTVTADAYEGIPASLEAGRYLVTVTATEETEFGGGVAFVQPVGVTVDEFLGVLSGPPAEGGAEPAGTPATESEATPAEGGEEMGGLPPFVFDSVFAGGAYAGPGESAQVVLDLGPGEWIAWADDPEAPQASVAFEVTGELPTDLAEPESDATLTMFEYDIQVTTGALVAGPQVIKVENVGAQPHFVAMAKGPDGMTEAQVMTVLEEEMAAEMSGATPVYSDINPEEDFGDGPYTPSQSMGTATWHPVTLEAGTYLMSCFFPDLADGMPHAYKGMIEVVEVAG